MNYNFEAQKKDKKKMWGYILSAIAVFLAILILLMVLLLRPGPADPVSERLNTPINLRVDTSGGDYVVRFSPVNNATGYTIYVAGEHDIITTVVSNELNITYFLNAYQTYEISVKAVYSRNPIYNSAVSQPLFFDFNKQLNAPYLEMDIDGTQLSWDAIPEADIYFVTVADLTFSTSLTTLNLNNYVAQLSQLAIGSYPISVKAGSNVNSHLLISDASNVLTYEVTRSLNAPSGLAANESAGVITASWNAVGDASEYILKIISGTGTTEISAGTNTQLDITQYVSLPYSYMLSVKALGALFIAPSEYSASVGYEHYVKFAAPDASLINIRKDGNYLRISWEAVPDATSYALDILNDENVSIYYRENITGTSFMAELAISAEGIYKVSLRTNAGPPFRLASDFTVPIRFDANTVLQTPAGLTLGGSDSNKYLTWEEVPYASHGYIVRAYDNLSAVKGILQVGGNFVNLSSVVALYGTFNFTVQAAGYDYYGQSYESAGLAATLKKALENPYLIGFEYSGEEINLVWTRAGLDSLNVYYSIYVSSATGGKFLTYADGQIVKINQPSVSDTRVVDGLGTVEVCAYNLANFINENSSPFIFKVQAFPNAGDNTYIQSQFSNEISYGSVVQLETPAAYISSFLDNETGEMIEVLYWSHITAPAGYTPKYTVRINNQIIIADYAETYFNLNAYLVPGLNTVSVCASGARNFLQSDYWTDTLDYDMVKLLPAADFFITSRVINDNIFYQANFVSVRHATHYEISIAGTSEKITVVRPVPLGVNVIISVEIPTEFVNRSGLTIFSIISKYSYSYAGGGTTNYSGIIFDSNAYEYHYRDRGTLDQPEITLYEQDGQYFASWERDERAAGYSLIIAFARNGVTAAPLSLPLPASASSYNFTDYVAANGAGCYTVSLRALGDNIYVGHSQTAVTQIYVQIQLAAPNARIEVNGDGKHEVVFEVVPWAGYYSIQLFADLELFPFASPSLNEVTSYSGTGGLIRLNVESALQAGGPAKYTIVAVALSNGTFTENSITKHYYLASSSLSDEAGYVPYLYQPHLKTPKFIVQETGGLIKLTLNTDINAQSYRIYASHTPFNITQMSGAELDAITLTPSAAVTGASTITYTITGSPVFATAGEIYITVQAISNKLVGAGRTYYLDSLTEITLYAHYIVLDAVEYGSITAAQVFSEDYSMYDAYGILQLSWGAVNHAAGYEIAIRAAGHSVVTVLTTLNTSININPSYFNIPNISAYKYGQYEISIRALDNLAAFYKASMPTAKTIMYLERFNTPSITFSDDPTIGQERLRQPDASDVNWNGNITLSRYTAMIRNYQIKAQNLVTGEVIYYSSTFSLDSAACNIFSIIPSNANAGVYQISAAFSGRDVYATSAFSKPLYYAYCAPIAPITDLKAVLIDGEVVLEFTPPLFSESYTVEIFSSANEGINYSLVDTLFIPAGSAVGGKVSLVISGAGLIDLNSALLYQIKVASNAVERTVTIPVIDTYIPTSVTYNAHLASAATVCYYTTDNILQEPGNVIMKYINGEAYLVWDAVDGAENYFLSYALKDGNGIYRESDAQTLLPWGQELVDGVYEWVQNVWTFLSDQYSSPNKAAMIEAVVGVNNVYQEDGRVYYPLLFAGRNYTVSYVLCASTTQAAGDSKPVSGTVLTAVDAPAVTDIQIDENAASNDFYINITSGNGGRVILSFENVLFTKLNLMESNSGSGSPQQQRWYGLYTILVNGYEVAVINAPSGTRISVDLTDVLLHVYGLIKDDAEFSRMFTISIITAEIQSANLTGVSTLNPDNAIPNGAYNFEYGKILYEQTVTEFMYLVPFKYEGAVNGLSYTNDPETNSYVATWDGAGFKFATSFTVEVCDENGNSLGAGRIDYYDLDETGQDLYSYDFSHLTQGLIGDNFTLRVYVNNDPANKIYGSRAGSAMTALIIFGRVATPQGLYITDGVTNTLYIDADSLAQNHRFELQIGLNEMQNGVPTGKIIWGEAGRTAYIALEDAAQTGDLLFEDGGVLWSTDITAFLLNIEGGVLQARIRMLPVAATFMHASAWSLEAQFVHILKPVITSVEPLILPADYVPGKAVAEYTAQEYNTKVLKISKVIFGVQTYSVWLDVTGTGLEYRLISSEFENSLNSVLPLNAYITEPGVVKVKLQSNGSGMYLYASDVHEMNVEVYFKRNAPAGVTMTVDYKKVNNIPNPNAPISAVLKMNTFEPGTKYSVNLYDAGTLQLVIAEDFLADETTRQNGFELIKLLNSIPPRVYIITVHAVGEGFFIDSSAAEVWINDSIKPSEHSKYTHHFTMPAVGSTTHTFWDERNGSETTSHGYVNFDAINVFGEYAGFAVYLYDSHNYSYSQPFICYVGKDLSGFYILPDDNTLGAFSIDALTGRISFDISIFARDSVNRTSYYLAGKYSYEIRTLIPLGLIGNSLIYNSELTARKAFDFTIPYPYSPSNIAINKYGNEYMLSFNLPSDTKMDPKEFVIEFAGVGAFTITRNNEVLGVYSNINITNFIRGGENRITIYVNEKPELFYRRSFSSDEYVYFTTVDLKPVSNLAWGDNNIITFNKTIAAQYTNLDAPSFTLELFYNASTNAPDASVTNKIAEFTLACSAARDASGYELDIIAALRAQGLAAYVKNDYALINGTYKLTVSLNINNLPVWDAGAGDWVIPYTAAPESIIKYCREPWSTPVTAISVTVYNLQGQVINNPAKADYADNNRDIVLSWNEVSDYNSEAALSSPDSYIINICNKTENGVLAYSIPVFKNPSLSTGLSYSGGVFSYNLDTVFRGLTGGEYSITVVAAGNDTFANSLQDNAKTHKHFVRLAAPVIGELEASKSGGGYRIRWTSSGISGVTYTLTRLAPDENFSDMTLTGIQTPFRDFEANANFLISSMDNALLIVAIPTGTRTDWYLESFPGTATIHFVRATLPPTNIETKMTNQDVATEYAVANTNNATMTISWDAEGQEGANYYRITVLSPQPESVFIKNIYLQIDWGTSSVYLLDLNFEGVGTPVRDRIAGTVTSSRISFALTVDELFTTAQKPNQKLVPGDYTIIVRGWAQDSVQDAMFRAVTATLPYRIKLDKPQVELTFITENTGLLTAAEVMDDSLEIKLDLSNLSPNAERFSYRFGKITESGETLWQTGAQGQGTYRTIEITSGSATIVITKQSDPEIYDYIVREAPNNFVVGLIAVGNGTHYVDSFEDRHEVLLQKQMATPDFAFYVDQNLDVLNPYNRLQEKSEGAREYNSLAGRLTYNNLSFIDWGGERLACDLYVIDKTDYWGEDKDAVAGFYVWAWIQESNKWVKINKDMLIATQFWDSSPNTNYMDGGGYADIYAFLSQLDNLVKGGFTRIMLQAIPKDTSLWMASFDPNELDESKYNVDIKDLTFYVRPLTPVGLNVVEVKYGNEKHDELRNRYGLDGGFDAYVPNDVILNWKIAVDDRGNTESYMFMFEEYGTREDWIGKPNAPDGLWFSPNPRYYGASVKGDNYDLLDLGFDFEKFQVYYDGGSVNGDAEIGGIGWWYIKMTAVKGVGDTFTYFGAGYPSKAIEYRVVLKLRFEHVDVLSTNNGVTGANESESGGKYVLEGNKEIRIHPNQYARGYEVTAEAWARNSLGSMGGEIAERKPTLNSDGMLANANLVNKKDEYGNPVSADTHPASAGLPMSTLFNDNVQGGKYGYVIQAYGDTDNIVFKDADPIEIKSDNEVKRYHHVARLNYNWDNGNEGSYYDPVIKNVENYVEKSGANNPMEKNYTRITFTNTPFATHYEVYYIQNVNGAAVATKLKRSITDSDIISNSAAAFTRDYEMDANQFTINIDPQVTDIMGYDALKKYLSGYVRLATSNVYLQPGKGMFVVVSRNLVGATDSDDYLPFNNWFAPTRNTVNTATMIPYDFKDDYYYPANIGGPIYSGAYEVNEIYREKVYVKGRGSNQSILTEGNQYYKVGFKAAGRGDPSAGNDVQDNVQWQRSVKFTICDVKFTVANFVQYDLGTLGTGGVTTNLGRNAASGNRGIKIGRLDGKLTNINFSHIPGAIGYVLTLTEPALGTHNKGKSLNNASGSMNGYINFSQTKGQTWTRDIIATLSNGIYNFSYSSFQYNIPWDMQLWNRYPSKFSFNATALNSSSQYTYNDDMTKLTITAKVRAGAEEFMNIKYCTNPDAGGSTKNFVTDAPAAGGTNSNNNRASIGFYGKQRLWLYRVDCRTWNDYTPLPWPLNGQVLTGSHVRIGFEIDNMADNASGKYGWSGQDKGGWIYGFKAEDWNKNRFPLNGNLIFVSAGADRGVEASLTAEFKDPMFYWNYLNGNNYYESINAGVYGGQVAKGNLSWYYGINANWVLSSGLLI